MIRDESSFCIPYTQTNRIVCILVSMKGLHSVNILAFFQALRAVSQAYPLCKFEDIIRTLEHNIMGCWWKKWENWSISIWISFLGSPVKFHFLRCLIIQIERLYWGPPCRNKTWISLEPWEKGGRLETHVFWDITLIVWTSLFSCLRAKLFSRMCLAFIIDWRVDVTW